jgi:hypothetical protein
MRTNEWRLSVSSRKRLPFVDATNKTMELEFASNGYVKTKSNERDNKKDEPATIGQWKLHPSGIGWDLKVIDRDKNESAIYHYHADLVLNPFGPHPHMIRGIVTRDCRRPNINESGSRKRWFLRPVVATFTGVGIGEDTVDVSYQDRGLGVTR